MNTIEIGSIITKDIRSYMSASVLRIDDEGIFVRWNENRYTKPVEEYWVGDYIRISEVRGMDWSIYEGDQFEITILLKESSRENGLYLLDRTTGKSYSQFANIRYTLGTDDQILLQNFLNSLKFKDIEEIKIKRISNEYI